MWPFRQRARAEKAGDGRPAAPSVGPQREWASFAPIQRTFDAAPGTFGTRSFEADLASRSAEPFLAPLGHLVSRDGPGGVVSGLATPRLAAGLGGGTSGLGAEKMPLASRPSIQRQDLGRTADTPARVRTTTYEDGASGGGGEGFEAATGDQPAEVPESVLDGQPSEVPERVVDQTGTSKPEVRSTRDQPRPVSGVVARPLVAVQLTAAPSPQIVTGRFPALPLVPPPATTSATLAEPQEFTLAHGREGEQDHGQPDPPPETHHDPGDQPPSPPATVEETSTAPLLGNREEAQPQPSVTDATSAAAPATATAPPVQRSMATEALGMGLPPVHKPEPAPDRPRRVGLGPPIARPPALGGSTPPPGLPAGVPSPVRVRLEETALAQRSAAASAPTDLSAADAGGGTPAAADLQAGRGPADPPSDQPGVYELPALQRQTLGGETPPLRTLPSLPGPAADSGDPLPLASRSSSESTERSSEAPNIDSSPEAVTVQAITDQSSVESSSGPAAPDALTADLSSGVAPTLGAPPTETRIATAQSPGQGGEPGGRLGGTSRLADVEGFSPSSHPLTVSRARLDLPPRSEGASSPAPSPDETRADDMAHTPSREVSLLGARPLAVQQIQRSSEPVVSHQSGRGRSEGDVASVAALQRSSASSPVPHVTRASAPGTDLTRASAFDPYPARASMATRANPIPAQRAGETGHAKPSEQRIRQASLGSPQTGHTIPLGQAAHPSAGADAGDEPGTLPLAATLQRTTEADTASRFPDPGTAALAGGIAERGEDGSIVFRTAMPEAAPPISNPPAVQRAAYDAAPPTTPAQAADTSAQAPAQPAARKPEELDKLAHDLYDRIRYRLKNELRLDRERAGLLTDLIR